LTGDAFIAIQVREIGNVFTHKDCPYIAAGFAGVAGDIFQTFNRRHRALSTPGLGRNTRAVFQLFFGKKARYF
jgi:hypothetical protein